MSRRAGRKEKRKLSKELSRETGRMKAWAVDPGGAVIVLFVIDGLSKSQWRELSAEWKEWFLYNPASGRWYGSLLEIKQST